MLPPKVSVVIPTYNRETPLKRAIESVLAQTFSDWELVIVDNHSGDGTKEMISAFNDERIQLHLIHNHGVIAASRNKGVQAASGEFVVFLDSDDWWKKDKLEKCIALLNEGKDVVFHDLALIRDENDLSEQKKIVTRDIVGNAFEFLIKNGNAIANSGVTVRKRLMDKIGGFAEDKELAGMEDFDAWLRLARITDKFARHPDCLGYYCLGDDNFTNPERTIRASHALLQRHGEAFEVYCGPDLPWWFNYTLGRAYFQNENNTEAVSRFRKIAFNNTPMNIYFKTLASRFLLTLRRGD